MYLIQMIFEGMTHRPKAFYKQLLIIGLRGRKLSL